MTNQDIDVDLLPYDSDLANAARQAALAFGKIARTLQDASTDGVTRPLVRILRSGRGLGPGECAVLADLIAGELCKPKGRPAKKAPDRERRRAILERYRGLMVQHKADGRQKRIKAEVIKQVAAEFRITEHQAEGIVKDPKMRG